ncbi:histidine kinase [Bifidobacterium longum]|uniref:histidine kinase n=1 Tax=Bifidobacterium longum TaxID=216816 RepID=UPI003D078F1A
MVRRLAMKTILVVRKKCLGVSKKNLVLPIVAMTCLAACIAEWILDSPESLNDGFYSHRVHACCEYVAVISGTGNMGIIVIAFLNELMPCLSQCDESWGVLVSLAIQGYAAVWWNGVTATVLLSISALLNYAIYRENSEFGSFDGSINLVVLLWFVFLLGVWLRQRNGLEKKKELEKEAEIVRYNLQLAEGMHDAMSGELTRMLVIVQEGIDASKEEELKRWRKLQNGINKIFQDLHSVMNYLSDDDHKQDEVFHVSLAEHIQATLSESDRRLHDKGFCGHSSLRGVSSAMLNSWNQIIVNLLREIYTNIERYADKSEYSVIVTFQIMLLICSGE